MLFRVFGGVGVALLVLDHEGLHGGVGALVVVVLVVFAVEDGLSEDVATDAIVADEEVLVEVVAGGAEGGRVGRAQRAHGGVGAHGELGPTTAHL